jgi:hypothetical protein
MIIIMIIIRTKYETGLWCKTFVYKPLGRKREKNNCWLSQMQKNHSRSYITYILTIQPIEVFGWYILEYALVPRYHI